MTNRLTVQAVQEAVGATPDGKWGPNTRAAVRGALTNRRAPAMTRADYVQAAERLGVTVAHIRAVRLVEAPRGPYDNRGLPAMLYERHVFARNSAPKGRFNAAYPLLSASRGYGKGGYGSYDGQIDKLLDACRLDVEAAFCAVSWGAFQVLGENARALGYASPLAMALALTESEAAHMDSFVRFVETNGLSQALAHCKPNDPPSCVPFVSRYNGEGYATFRYDAKMAEALYDARGF